MFGWGAGVRYFAAQYVLILMYAFIVLVLFFYCQADFDVDNVQRRELVIFYGV